MDTIVVEFRGADGRADEILLRALYAIYDVLFNGAAADDDDDVGRRTMAASAPPPPVGMTQRQLNERLGPRFRRYQAIRELPKDDTPTCAICCDNLAVGEYARTLWCEHRFHKRCIDQWFRRQSVTAELACPLCRATSSEVDLDRLSGVPGEGPGR